MQLLADQAAVATADWTEALAIATFLLFAATVGVTAFQTRRDNKRRMAELRSSATKAVAERARAAKQLKDERDRADLERERADRLLSEQRQIAQQQIDDEHERTDRLLAEQRQIAQQQIEAERAFAASERIRERQAERSRALLARVAKLRDDLLVIGSYRPEDPSNREGLRSELDRVRSNLVEGAHIDAPLIGNPEVENRYKNLVHLVLSLTSIGASSPTHQHTEDLRNYAKFVKFSLAALVNGDALPESGSSGMPRIDRAPGDGVIWHPDPVPQGWDNEDALDQYDPRFRSPP